MSYFLGIDAGGSNCRARLTDESGRLLGTASGGPANARIGLDKLRVAILSVATEAFESAGLQPAAMEQTRAGFGLAGISRPGLRAGVEALDWPFGSVKIDSDGAIANLGAHGGLDGATLIIGTGSIAYIRVGGSTKTIGGYGFPISDEGSGAALGLSAMRHALRALDGRTRPTPLSHAVTEQFDHITASAIAWMDQATPREYASLAPMVLEHAERNDEIACFIVEEAVRHVERFIQAIFAEGAPRCSLAGGLAPRLKPWLRLRTVARLSEALGDPLDGALLLAGMEHLDPKMKPER